MKNWKQSEIIGNQKEAIREAINELQWAYRHAGGHAKDSIETALNRLGCELETDEEETERKRSEYIAMTF